MSLKAYSDRFRLCHQTTIEEIHFFRNINMIIAYVRILRGNNLVNVSDLFVYVKMQQ